MMMIDDDDNYDNNDDCEITAKSHSSIHQATQGHLPLSTVSASKSVQNIQSPHMKVPGNL